MQKFAKSIVVTVALGAIAIWWPHRGRTILPFRKTCVLLGLHFPIPFTGLCVCGLPLKLLSSGFWFDRMQLQHTAQMALEKGKANHGVHWELDWYRNLERKSKLADAVSQLLLHGKLRFDGMGKDDWNRWLKDEYEKEEWPDWA